MSVPDKLPRVELYAWVGEDDRIDGEPRSEEIGLKQGVCPAGMIPMVATTREKMAQSYITAQMETQAAITGKRRYLARFTFAGVVDRTKAGE